MTPWDGSSSRGVAISIHLLFILLHANLVTLRTFQPVVKKMLQEIRVTTTESNDPAAATLLREIHRTLGLTQIAGVRVVKVFRLEGLTEEEARRFAEVVLVEPLTQRFRVNAPLLTSDRSVEVAYKPGVMNPESASILKVAKDLGFDGLVAVDSSHEYHFDGEMKCVEFDQIVKRLLVNKTVQRVVTETPKTLIIESAAGGIAIVPIRDLNGADLMALSKDKLFLNLEEMRVIQQHFLGLGRDPTDCELETPAQTWSEHCGHKSLRARVIVDGTEKPPLMHRLKEASKKRYDLTVSSFVDNSGVLRFYDGWAVCGKVETHNSPSAIEPYGGAATGSGGVFRDIMGTGLGAKTILSTDMFCLAPPDLPIEELPPGCLHPSYLLQHVVRGVKDYGNRMGIPTANGSFHFHPDFRAKPSVIVGAYGLIPEAQAQKGHPKPGDKIVAMGGRTGRDGIHGATFSSAEMTERTISVNSTAVQIGNAIEEKRMSDALLACRDECLIRAVTDCGAGGFSSAIGEMGSKTGVRVFLERAPLKYPGLAPWEIWISESQERMVLAIAPENEARVLEICRNHNVEATVLGEFTDDGQLVVTHDGRSVCDLSMEFLHNGLPQRVMNASWKAPVFEEPNLAQPRDWAEAWKRVLAHRNVCSKQPIARLYDHGVQGMNALPPYGGVFLDGPNDAIVLRPLLDKPYGLVVSHGLNPILMRIDPYWGAIWACTEALANLVAVGGDPSQVGLIDNFIWPFPDEESLGALDRAVDACCDFAKATGLDFVSGKDSLSSTYRGKDGTVIKIPPVLCISAFGKIPDVAKTVTSDFKRPNSMIILVGKLDADAMGGSVYYDIHGAVGNTLPHVDLQMLDRTLTAVHRAIDEGLVLSCHDVSEGGIAVALTEMCIGGNCGATLDFVSALGSGRLDHLLFNEMAGCFLIEVETSPNPVSYQRLARVHHLLRNIPHETIGITHEQSFICGEHNVRDKIFRIPLHELKAAWQAPMKEVF